jgi:hypothetical protein
MHLLYNSKPAKATYDFVLLLLRSYLKQKMHLTYKNSHENSVDVRNLQIFALTET